MIGGAVRGDIAPYGSYMPYVIGQWNHVVITRQGAVSTAYVNGRKTGQAYTNSSAATTTVMNLYLARDTSNNSNLSLIHI